MIVSLCYLCTLAFQIFYKNISQTHILQHYTIIFIILQFKFHGNKVLIQCTLMYWELEKLIIISAIDQVKK